MNPIESPADKPQWPDDAPEWAKSVARDGCGGDEAIQRRNEALLDDSAFHELQRQLEQALDELDEARRELESFKLIHDVQVKERDKIRAELADQMKFSERVSEIESERDKAQNELSALKSQKGGSTIESMGGVEVDTHAKQLSEVALNDGTANPETLVRQAAIATASGTAVSPVSPSADTQRGSNAPPHASSGQREGVPTREELKDLVWKTLRQSAYSCDSGTCHRVADAVRLACVGGELSFEEWVKKYAIRDGSTIADFLKAFNAARTTRDPKGAIPIDHKAELLDCMRELDTLRRQLVRSVEDHQNVIQTLIERDRQLSDAQSEVSRLSGLLTRFNEMEKELASAQAEVERLCGEVRKANKMIMDGGEELDVAQAEVKRLEEYKASAREIEQNLIGSLTASQSTVERLREALEKLKDPWKLSDTSSVVGFADRLSAIATDALASITAPPTITSADEATRLHQALQLATDWIKLCPPNDTSEALLEKMQTLTPITATTDSILLTGQSNLGIPFPASVPVGLVERAKQALGLAYDLLPGGATSDRVREVYCECQRYIDDQKPDLAAISKGEKP